MCGLIGCAGDLTADSVKAFKQMLYCDTLRGEDSTGVAAIGFQGNQISIIKALGGAHYLLDMKKFDNEVNAGKYVLIGHNRWGTVGGKSIGNAHPFQHGDIVGAHNGTLPPDARRRLGNENEFGTDSEQIIHSINENGVAQTVEKINGAWAVVFYDKLNNQISMFRNKERDLWYAFSTDLKQLFWASEGRMLQWILERNGIKFEKIHQLPVDKLFSWVIPRTTQVFNVEEGEVCDLKEHTAPPVVERFQGWFPKGVKEAQEKGAKTGEVLPFVKGGGTGKEPEFEDVPWPDDELIEQLAFGLGDKSEKKSPPTNYPTMRTYVNPKTGILMTKNEFDQLVEAGCDWCSGNIEWGTNVRFRCEASTGEIECFCETCNEGRSGLERYLGVIKK